jgi:hypothetical protein
VYDQHPVERKLEGAARGADRAAGVVVEGLGAQQGDLGALRALGQRPQRRAPFREVRLEAVLAPLQLPALGQALQRSEADVVPAARVLGAGIAESDDQPVDRSAAAAAEEAFQGRLLLAV